MGNTLDCPVDRVLVNENKARMVAALVVVLAIIFVVTPNIAIPISLILDFSLRATAYGKYSVLGFIADIVGRWIGLKNKPTDRAPKRFAASVGLVFSVLILASLLFHFVIFVYSLSLILTLFAILESVFGFCAGCFVYSFLKRWHLLHWN